MEHNDDLMKLHGEHHLSVKEIFKRTWKYIKPEIWMIILALFIIILQVICQSLVPLIFENLINTLNEKDPLKLTMMAIASLALGAFGISFLGQIFLYFEAMILQRSGQKIVYNLRMEVFTHIENMSINQFNDMPVGSLVTRVANYTTAMSDLFTNTIVSLFRNIFTILIIFIIMIFRSWQLSLIMLALCTVIFVATYFFTRAIGKEFRKYRTMTSELNAFLNENLSGMKITQLFNQQERKTNDFSDKNIGLRNQRFKVVKIFAFYRPFVQFTYYLGIALTFICGVNLHLNAGTIVAFYLFLGNFFEPIQNLADQINNLSNANSSAEKLYNLLDVKPEVLNCENALEIDHFEGRIEFKNVWFAYKENEWILKDVSFVIEPKTTCAFVGATGAGKTTILSLIVRNFEIQKGQILIDGIDIKTIKIESLRKAIGQMLQDVFLFSGSIRSNITLRDEEYTDQEIMDVCHYVNADSFINKLDKKLDAEVVEKGDNFSQGQRQLLSFARTILHKPQILILDEATANIDTETEQLIQDSLEKMKSIGTMLIVAHRLSTIQKADQIICLQNGQIVERGNHQDLLKNKGYYYKLYLLQFDEEK